MLILKIKLHDVSLKIGHKSILNRINLGVNEGEKIAILGPNGAGKTTLINATLGLHPISSGIIHNDFKKLKPWKVGYHMQDSALNRLMTVKEVISLFSFDQSNHDFRLELMKMLGINGIEKQKIESLSGGEKQRLLIFLVYQNQPSIIFVDEVTTGIDALTRKEIVSFMNRYINENKLTSVYVTHYLEEAKELAERFVFMDNGRIIEDGHIKDLYEKYNIAKMMRIENYSNDSQLTGHFAGFRDVFYYQDKSIIEIKVENIKQMSEAINTLNEIKYSGTYSIIEPDLEQLYRKIYDERGEQNEQITCLCQY